MLPSEASPSGASLVLQTRGGGDGSLFKEGASRASPFARESAYSVACKPERLHQDRRSFIYGQKEGERS
jgi:hypothetical protein